MGTIAISIVTVVIPALVFSFVTNISFNAAMDVVMELALAQLFIIIMTYYWMKFRLNKEKTTIFSIGSTGKYFLKGLRGI